MEVKLSNGNIVEVNCDECNNINCDKSECFVVSDNVQKVEYRILSYCRKDILESNVNRCIEEGWRPIGGVAIEYSDNLPIYIQAMYKG